MSPNELSADSRQRRQAVRGATVSGAPGRVVPPIPRGRRMPALPMPRSMSPTSCSLRATASPHRSRSPPVSSMRRREDTKACLSRRRWHFQHVGNAAVCLGNRLEATPDLANLGDEVVVRVDHGKCRDPLVVGHLGHGRSSELGRVPSEDVIAILRGFVAGKARPVQRFVARFAVREVGKSPAAGCTVLL
jgi:hypothetical protein